MARKSPPVANTGCKWTMFRIFNFSKSHSKRRLVSAAGNGNLRSSSDLIGTVDEKYPRIGVSSGRRYVSSKSMSNVKNDRVADPRNEVAKMVIDQRFTNQNFLGKDQLLDAVQILYSNKELFLKLLKDPNSMLVKHIHDLPSSEMKKPYQDNVQQIKPSRLHFGRIKRKSRYVVKVRRKIQQRRTINGAPYRFTCGCHGIEVGKKVNESKIARISSSSSRNTNNPTNPYEQDILNNVHVEGSKSLSEMLSFRVEESNRRANSKVRTNPLPDFKSFPRMRRYREHDSVAEGVKYDNNYHQILIETKSSLRKEPGNGFFSSSGQKTNAPPEAIVKIPNEKFQIFGSDIRIRKSALGHNIHAHYDSPRDGGFKNTPTQNFDINNDALGGIGTFLDSFSPEVESSSSSPSQRIVDNINMTNRIVHPSTEPSFEHFTKEDVTNSKMTLHKPDKSPPQVFGKVTHFEDLIRPSLGLINNLTSSKDILNYVMEILHALSFKYDELFMKCKSSTFDELNGLLLTSQLSSNKVLVHCIIETLMEVYKNNGFPPKILDIQPYVVNIVMVKEIIALINLQCLPQPTPITVEELVEKDLVKNGSWLNIKVGIEDIIIEVEEHVLQKLALEIVIEMDIRSMIHWNQTSIL